MGRKGRKRVVRRTRAVGVETWSYARFASLCLRTAVFERGLVEKLFDEGVELASVAVVSRSLGVGGEIEIGGVTPRPIVSRRGW